MVVLPVLVTSTRSVASANNRRQRLSAAARPLGSVTGALHAATERTALSGAEVASRATNNRQVLDAD